MKYRLVLSMALYLGFSAGSYAVPVHVYEGEPPYPLSFWKASYVAIGGETYISGLEAMDYFSGSTEPQASWDLYIKYGSRGINASDEIFYDSVIYTDWGYINRSFDLGIYGNWNPNIWQTGTPNRHDDYPERDPFVTNTKLVVPRVFNIPVSVHPNTILDYNTHFLAEIALAQDWGQAFVRMGLVSTNILEMYPNDTEADLGITGCASWYDMSAWTNTTSTAHIIRDKLDFLKLRPGINIVSRIDWCDEPLEGILGCADVGGNRIAVSLESGEPRWYQVALHEIGHSQGIVGHSKDRGNIMYEAAVPSAMSVTLSQCVALQKAKNY